MFARAVRAHFDGQHIHLDEPCALEPDMQLLVLVLPKHNDESEHADWLKLSQQRLANAYSDEEPEYSLDLIKELRPAYACASS